MLSLLILLACGPPNQSDALLAELSAGEVVPNVLTARVTPPLDGVAWVDWAVEGEPLMATPPERVVAGQPVDLQVLGLPSGERVTVQVMLEDEDGNLHEGEPQTWDVPLEPAELPPRLVTGALAEGGWLLTSEVSATRTWVVVLDTLARPVWYLPLSSNTLVVAAEPMADGRGLLIMADEFSGERPETTLQELAWDGTVQRRMLLPDGHHDFALLPDDRVAWIQQEVMPHTLDGEPVDVVVDAVRISPWQDIAAISGPPPFSFRTRGLPEQAPCEHQLRPVDMRGGTYLDWTHANSLGYDAYSDQLFLMTHHLDRIQVIPVEDPALSWELRFDEGDPQDDTDDPWSHAHSSHMSATELLLFDNAIHTDGGSRVVAYDVDASTGELTPTRVISEPQGRTVVALGDALVTPAGNTLISWSTLGRISEVAADDEELWSISTAAGVGLGRLVWLETLP